MKLYTEICFNNMDYFSFFLIETTWNLLPNWSHLCLFTMKGTLWAEGVTLSSNCSIVSQSMELFEQVSLNNQTHWIFKKDLHHSPGFDIRESEVEKFLVIEKICILK